jgi:DNA-binding PadR family transcriptional regulator
LKSIVSRKQPRVDFIELHILHHAGEEPLYGLWMIEELAGHGYKVGASHLYPKFHRLEQEGFLRRTERVIEGKVRKYYRLTVAGRKYLRDQKRRLIELGAEVLVAKEIEAMLHRRAARDEREASQ